MMLPFFNEKGMLTPERLLRNRVEYPKTMIVTWQAQILRAIDRKYEVKQMATFRCGVPCAVYGFQVKRENLAVVVLPIGSPVVAGFMEEVIVQGVRRFVCVGYAGSLSPVTRERVVVPTRAFRDEGTSWHYVEHESEWIEIPSARHLDAVLSEMGVPHVCGPVWTTDAMYRETASAVKLMRERQCLCVDMECAAVMAVAQFRQVQCLQMMFGADRLESEEWNVGKMRGLGRDAYEKYAEIAVKVGMS